MGVKYGRFNLFLVVLMVLWTSSTAGYLVGNRKEFDQQAVDRLERLLFPNRTAQFRHDYNGRSLAIAKPAWDPNNRVACSRCQGLSVCNILNGFLVEEVYLPKTTSRRETCNVIEAFGKRIQGEVFGNGRTFRDTPECRDIVMQYLCLYYGSDNYQYRNFCVYQEDATPPLAADKLYAKRQPCHGFCVQIASVCANDPTFIQTCKRIPCPMGDGKCEADPIIQKQAIATNLGCDVPYFRTPYNSATTTHSINGVLTLFCTAVLSLFYLVIVV